jgi:hypothetical protein
MEEITMKTKKTRIIIAAAMAAVSMAALSGCSVHIR